MNCILRTAVLIMLASLSSSEAGFAQQTPYRLTLQGAIQKALQANLNVLVAGTRVDEAQGTRERRLSAALLPRVTAQTYANYQNRDLRAFGISLPPIPGFAGLPSVVGPFSNYDFRVYAQQNVIDLESYRGLKASERALDAGKWTNAGRARSDCSCDCNSLSQCAVRGGARGFRTIASDGLKHPVETGQRQA
jgi:outer membrane protein TolC